MGGTVVTRSCKNDVRVGIWLVVASLVWAWGCGPGEAGFGSDDDSAGSGDGDDDDADVSDDDDSLGDDDSADLPPPPLEEAFEQYADPVDILFVVDNSCSMMEEQEALRDNFVSLFAHMEGVSYQPAP